MLPEFLLSREVRLRLERVRSTMLTRRPTRATLFSSRSYQARCRDPLRGGLEGGNRTFTIQGWGNLHNLIGGSQQTTELHHNGMWLRGDLFRLGHQCTPRVTRSTRKSGGNQIIFGGSVDRGLLFQTLENQQVVMARERDRARISFWASMVKL